MDDFELLQAYTDKRSEDAFRELVQRHLPLVHAAALRQVNGDAYLAQDVAQRVFISLARKAHRLGRHHSIVGWLYTAARLEGCRAVRTELRRRRREQGAAVMNSTDASEISSDRLRAVLDDAMAELEGDDREVMLLRYFSGRTFGDIGRTLKVSEDGARKRVSRALDKLRGRLQGVMG
jgi:RNA polymerase sigma factor (sigma-70 family)